jgi:UDP-hydrolysing UDP-N-acetyl-D-glucosamine 2-epimerase
MRFAVLSTGRQDWGILRSTAVMLRESGTHSLVLLAGGMACSTAFGDVAAMMEEEGFRPERLPWHEPSAAAEAGAALAAVGTALERARPDALVLVGDRYETLAAATAATLLNVPIVHFHGGEETAGAFDDNLRNAVTKLSHLHFVSHPEHARRVVAMGEEPRTVVVVGAPGLDNLRRNDLATREMLEAHLGRELPSPVVVVTHHPTTYGDPEAEISAVVRAMDMVDATYVITLPNSDPGSAHIRAALVAAAARGRRVAVDALGERRYWGLLQIADATLGNSSSALIEAPVLGLPAVNVGDRQKGRTRGGNVINVAVDADAIASALKRALTPEFRSVARNAGSPFGDGYAGVKIGEVLARWIPPSPPIKRLYIPGEESV